MHLKRTLDFILVLAVVLEISQTVFGKPASLPKFDETFFMPQSMHEKHVSKILTYKDRMEDLRSPWNEESGNSLQAPPFPSTITTCPWTYTVVYNVNRIPQTVLEATCSTQQCEAPLNPHNTTHTGNPIHQSKSNTSKYHHTMSPPHLCREVKYYRWVKVKSPQKNAKGKSKYLPRLLPLTVACSCISSNQIEAETV